MIVNPEKLKQYLTFLTEKCAEIERRQVGMSESYLRMNNGWKDQVSVITGMVLRGGELKLSEIYSEIVKIINFAIEKYNEYTLAWNEYGREHHLDEMSVKKLETALSVIPASEMEFHDEHITDVSVIERFLSDLNEYIGASRRMLVEINENGNMMVAYWTSETHNRFRRKMAESREYMEAVLSDLVRCHNEIERKLVIFRRGGE